MNAILHADKKWGIGKKNDLMFRLPADMKFFRETTSGKTVCMGYNTLLSFPNGAPLKNRKNIVLCPDGVERDDCVCVHNLSVLKRELEKETDPDNVFVIGGASFYALMLDYCDKVYLTKVDADGGAEVFFRNLDEDKNFVCVSESPTVCDNGYNIKFTVYKNKSPRPLDELDL